MESCGRAAGHGPARAGGGPERSGGRPPRSGSSLRARPSTRPSRSSTRSWCARGTPPPPGWCGSARSRSSSSPPSSPSTSRSRRSGSWWRFCSATPTLAHGRVRAQCNGARGRAGRAACELSAGRPGAAGGAQEVGSAINRPSRRKSRGLVKIGTPLMRCASCSAFPSTPVTSTQRTGLF
jgi:hypothetical protein